MRSTALSAAYALPRVAYGLGLVAAPGRVGSAWLGPTVERGPARTAARGLGVRDAAMSAGVLAAVLRDENPTPWIAACVAGDLLDIAATLADRDSLPDRAAPGTVALAGAFALAGLGLALALRSP